MRKGKQRRKTTLGAPPHHLETTHSGGFRLTKPQTYSPTSVAWSVSSWMPVRTRAARMDRILLKLKLTSEAPSAAPSENFLAWGIFGAWIHQAKASSQTTKPSKPSRQSTNPSHRPKPPNQISKPNQQATKPPNQATKPPSQATKQWFGGLAVWFGGLVACWLGGWVVAWWTGGLVACWFGLMVWWLSVAVWRFADWFGWLGG